MRMNLHAIGIAIALAVLALGAPADAGPRGRQVRYVGIHPIPKAEGGGICYIEGPHVHIFAANKLEYRDHRGANYFVGDPVAYGYDGPKYAYKGNHPIHVDAVVDDGVEDTEYCYIEGPHYHYFEPPISAEFKVAGDAYFYVGEPAPAYVEARPAMVRVNAIYTPMVYTRPVVTVEPPSGWIGIRAGFGAPAAVVVDQRPAAVIVDEPVVRAGVEVHIPTPTLSIGIGIGGGTVVRDRPVYIREHDRGHRKHRKWK